MDVSPKVSASTGAVGVAGSMAVIITWTIGLAHIPVPPEVAVAITTVISAAAAFGAGWVVRHVTPPAAAPQPAPVNPQ